MPKLSLEPLDKAHEGLDFRRQYLETLDLTHHYSAQWYHDAECFVPKFCQVDMFFWPIIYHFTLQTLDLFCIIAGPAMHLPTVQPNIDDEGPLVGEPCLSTSWPS